MPTTSPNARERALHRALENGRARREGLERGARFAELERDYDEKMSFIASLSRAFSIGGGGFL